MCDIEIEGKGGVKKKGNKGFGERVYSSQDLIHPHLISFESGSAEINKGSSALEKLTEGDHQCCVIDANPCTLLF